MAGGMKRLAKETAVYGLSSIVGRFLNWMLVPMYTRVLAGTGDYGIVTNLYGWTALLLVLLTYGMETGFFRFINKKEEQEPMRVYASVLYCLLGSSALFSVAVFALLPSISAGLGYGDHPEYIGMMAGIVAVEDVYKRQGHGLRISQYPQFVFQISMYLFLGDAAYFYVPVIH